MQPPSKDTPKLSPFKRVRLTLWILFRSLRMRLFANILTVIAIMLGVGLALVVPLSLRAFQRGAVEAAQIFDLLVTAEGSETQAVLNTIYYQNAPLGNIPYTIYESLKDNGQTMRAVPLGFGDNVQGFPLVGTTLAYFDLRASQTAPPYYQLARGELFSHAFDAVLGAQVARELELSLGDTFQSSHGFSSSFEPTMHSNPFTVVGILKATGGPSDRAIYTPMESIWNAHGQFSLEEHTVDAAHACSHMRDISGETLEADGTIQKMHQRYNLDRAGNSANLIITNQATYALFSNQSANVTLKNADGQIVMPEFTADEDTITGCFDIAHAAIYELAAGAYQFSLESSENMHLENTPNATIGLVLESLTLSDHHHNDVPPLEDLATGLGHTNDSRQVTAVLYATKDIAALYQYSSMLDDIVGVQAIFPGQVINGLLTMLGQGQQSYGLLANVILALAVITIALNAYSNAIQAQRNLAILRAVGVERSTVAWSVLLEAILLSLLGIILGVFAAYGGVRFVATLIQNQASISLPTPELNPADWWRSAIILPAAVLFALLPALRAAGRSPLKQL